MAEEHKVKLHGTWTSPYTKWVELALKLKGILFEYVVEDLVNQSPLLLKYNPVHKKVPILVHNGKSISKSSIILEYIDETWPNALRFLPKDPYKRAKVRFWAGFFQQHLYETMFLILKTDGETQEKAIKELSEKFGMLEEGMKDLFPDGTPFDDRIMGLLDILLCSTFGAYKAQEEVLGLKVIDPNKNPLIFSWLNALIEVPVVKESCPPYEKECCFPIYVSSCVVLFLGDKTSILVGLCSH